MAAQGSSSFGSEVVQATGKLSRGTPGCREGPVASWKLGRRSVCLLGYSDVLSHDRQSQGPGWRWLPPPRGVGKAGEESWALSPLLLCGFICILEMEKKNHQEPA